ncbi:MAG: hypothetical protein H0T96_06450, partial [Thermoleophilaceae bacterium]|nr:hypothetical protein [Thermoleophilaceae bacterium]
MWRSRVAVTVAQQRTLEPSTPVLLLHGWIFQSDLNWYRTYKPLIAAGYRVLA